MALGGGSDGICSSMKTEGQRENDLDSLAMQSRFRKGALYT